MLFLMKLQMLQRLKSDFAYREEVRNQLETGQIRIKFSVVSTALIVFLLVFGSIFFAHSMDKSMEYEAGAGYKSLNEKVKRGEEPKDAEFVTLSFSVVGQPFKVEGHDDYILFPAVIYKPNDGTKGDVYEIAVSTADSEIIEEYSKLSKISISAGLTHNEDMEILEYKGRVRKTETTDEQYKIAVKDSGILESKYNIKGYLINTRVEPSFIPSRLYGIMLMSLVTVCVSYLTIAVMDFLILQKIYS